MKKKSIKGPGIIVSSVILRGNLDIFGHLFQKEGEVIKTQIKGGTWNLRRKLDNFLGLKNFSFYHV